MTTPFRTALSNTVHAQRGSGERHHEIDPDGDVLLVLENPNKAFAPWDDCLDAGLQGLDLCEPDNRTHVEKYLGSGSTRGMLVSWESVSILKTDAMEQMGTKSKKDKKKKKKQKASEHATIATINGPETNETPLVGVEVNRTPVAADSPDRQIRRFIATSQSCVSYFKKALSELWAKTLVHSEDGRRHLQAADWDADALLILMQIFHARTKNIPRSVDLEQLAKIAVLVDYYKCHDTVEFFATLWIHSLQEQLSLQCNRELILWLLVSVVFRRDDLFQAVTKIAVTKSKGPLPTLELPVLQSPIDQIDKRRQDAIADILGTLDKLNATTPSNSSRPFGSTASRNNCRRSVTASWPSPRQLSQRAKVRSRLWDYPFQKD
uniref:BTB domain-containing protein n=1 Tax=Colletotrichum fructicola (strain Nara gc5) TaxID=1213859 RepID=L2GBU8_COLFN